MKKEDEIRKLSKKVFPVNSLVEEIPWNVTPGTVEVKLIFLKEVDSIKGEMLDTRGRGMIT